MIYVLAWKDSLPVRDGGIWLYRRPHAGDLTWIVDSKAIEGEILEVTPSR
jgi:hypothetical protein